MIVTPGFRRRALVVALTGIYGMGSQLAHANPTGAQVVNGQAAVQTQGNRLTVTNTPGAIINWQSFSIGAGETTYFQQQNAASAVLNRVQAQNPSLKSQIDGTLGSNGRVFLINPNGIVFGAGSVVDTQGFVASTLNLNDADFKAGKMKFSAQAQAGDMQAQGRITSGNGDVYLIAPNIRVDGTAVITSEGGNIVLAAGEMVEITGRNLNDITFAIQSKDNQAINLGTLSGGAIGVFAGTLNHSGTIRAQSLVNEGGKLVLKAVGDVTLGAGSKTIADGQTLGGNISIESKAGNVLVDTGALVSAQATGFALPGQAVPLGGNIALSAGSGIVSIERGALVTANGGRGGSIDLQSAKLAQDGAISADGNSTVGGTVTLIADSRVIQTGSATVSAKGQLRGGDIKVSVDADPNGTGYFFSSASIDASATTGVGGNVTVSGRELNFADARLAANGDAGGGSVLVGGGKYGKDSSIANAQAVNVNGSSTFEASARVDGDGGTVVAWADGTNRFAGFLEARGGANGGNGGSIEVSGKEETQFGGLANAGAPFGQNGTFLLDPKYILIQTPPAIAGVSVELIDPNPGANNHFGQNYSILSNGNILVLDSSDDFAATNAGAVYLFDGTSGSLISALRGGTANDQVGSSVQTLTSGKLAIFSPNWANGAATLAGAITWADPLTGVSGAVSAANSLVGSFSNDHVGSGGISSLGNGKYYVATGAWNGNAGAVTWIDSAAPTTGAISAANSLVGGSPNDRVGLNGIYNLGYGKTLVFSEHWNGDMGAVTWFDNASGTVGAVNSANSLVGSVAGDQVGSGFYDTFGAFSPTKLAIFSPQWQNGSTLTSAVGAITWADAGTVTTGIVSGANSLVGSNANDRVGSNGIDFLTFSGSTYKYYVQSPYWNGSAGAVTWLDSTAPPVGAISSSNSLVGANPGDGVGSGGVRTLSSGNYVVLSPNAAIGGMAGAGAVTWGSGSSGVSGTVGATNSLVGTHANDNVGSGGITELFSAGNYVISSSAWNGGRGAVTFAAGNAPITGSPDAITTSTGNSILGVSTSDSIGSAGVRELDNGNFVVFSPNFTNTLFTATNAGAFTWGSGSAGFTLSPGAVSSANSLVGTHTNDRVGINPSSNFFDESGYYLLRSPNWNSSAGAVTFSTGTAPIASDVTASNSLIGSNANDGVGSTITILNSGNYLVLSPNWANTTFNSLAGAVTFGDASVGVFGGINSNNSLVGTQGGDRLGSGGVTILSSGNYLIKSPSYHGGAGAITWVADSGNPITGSVGVENLGNNSIFGNVAADAVGSGGIQFLDYFNSSFNYGNFVVLSPNATNPSGSIANAGAVTFGDTNSGFTGAGGLSSNNSLLGANTNDHIGSGGIVRLYNPADTSHSNYLIKSPGYSANNGAISWASGTSAVHGTIGSEANGNSIFGNSSGDGLGSGGVSILNNYNFAVLTPNATNLSGSISGAGAVTFGSQSAGFTNAGVLSSSNSLIGNNANDHIGNGGIVALYDTSNYLNSNYLIKSPSYGGGAGAVTWASGTSAVAGTISSESNGNSIFGTISSDAVGNSGITVFGNYNFVVRSPNVTSQFGSVAGVGAATFGTEAAGFGAGAGAVSTTNSLMGSNTNDHVGSGNVQELSNGTYAILSPGWNGTLGAISWGNTSTGLNGTVGAGNSLVGSATGDGVGSASLVSFGSGYYARSALWSSGAGAITWINTSAPLTGAITAANSLVGTSANDSIGSGGVYQLGGNKIGVFSSNWDNGAAVDAGAVTWLDATSASSGFTGTVSAANSLVGSSTGDQVGSGLYSFVSGTSNTYAVKSANWDNGAASNAGALTWFSPSGSLPVGAVSANNSLVGSNTNDAVGGSGTNFTAGTGYVLVRNAAWNSNRSAVTWMSSTAPLTGVISSANSLVGANPNDLIGNAGIYANSSFYLANGDYVVASSSFGGTGVGALTVGAKSGGISGVVSAANSLVGFGTNFQFVNTRTRLLVAAPNASNGAGRICLYSGGAGCDSGLGLSAQLYGNNPGASITISPAQITAITNSGTNVLLEANSDITLDALSDIVTNNPSGNGGDLTLHAGRSVLLKSNITTDNGNLTIIGNDSAADASYRDPGFAQITMADGTFINAGTGSVVIHLLDGSGARAGSDDLFNLNLRSITASQLSVSADFGGINIGDLSGVMTTASQTDINIASASPSLLTVDGDVSLNAKTTVRLSGVRNASALLSATGQVSIDAVNLQLRGTARIQTTSTETPPINLKHADGTFTLCDAVSCLRVGENVISSPTSNISELAAGFLLSLDPIYRPDHEDKSEGEIEIEAGETCK